MTPVLLGYAALSCNDAIVRDDQSEPQGLAVILAGIHLRRNDFRIPALLAATRKPQRFFSLQTSSQSGDNAPPLHRALNKKRGSYFRRMRLADRRHAPRRATLFVLYFAQLYD